jgi:predicted N-acyltransferase
MALAASVFVGIESVDRAHWDAVTCAAPYANWAWCRFGEIVLGQPGHYVIVLDGDQPIGGAMFSVLRQEQLPVSQPVLRWLLERYLSRRPLLMCRTPALTRYHGIFLSSAPSQRGPALSAITHAALKIARQRRTSFLIFDYLTEVELNWPWGRFVRLGDFQDAGMKLPITWTAFEDYLTDLREHSKSAYQDYRKHIKRAEALGIKVMVEPHATHIDEAMALIRSVDVAFRQPSFPYTRQLLENASHAPGAAWVTAHIDTRLVACGLLLYDPATGVCSPVLYGRDYSVDYAYFCTFYEVIRFAIEELYATTLIGESGAYEFKRRLGFIPDRRNNLVFATPSRLGQTLSSWLARAMR